MRRDVMAAMVLQAAVAGPAAAASDAAPEIASQLEEIVVTARRTAETLQRVPISMSAISAEDLAERSIESLSDVGQTVPNLLFGERGASGRGSAVVYIRGVGQADVRPTYDPAVGIYVDGVFLGRMQGNDLDTMDVERVEVLRGPQGTLFGKNTSGGALNIVTRQPDLQNYSGKLQLTAGSRSRFDTLGSVNIPLVADKAALLVAASHRTQDGYGTRADGQDMANTDRTSGRLALRLQLTDDFSALFAADALTYDETNSMFKLISVYPAPPIALINRFTPVPYDERWLSQSDFFNFAGGPNSSRGDLYGAALTLRYDLGAAELKSISAYRDNVVHSDQDADLSPVTVLDEYDVSRQDQFSQELQASGTSLGERLNWVLGLYYFEESVHNKVDFELVPALQPIIGNRSFSNDLRVRNESYAAFGQTNYGLTEQLRLTAGLRYTHDRKEVDRRNLTYPSGVPNQAQAIREASSDDVSTRVGLDYQWTPAAHDLRLGGQGLQGRRVQRARQLGRRLQRVRARDGLDLRARPALRLSRPPRTLQRHRVLQRLLRPAAADQRLDDSQRRAGAVQCRDERAEGAHRGRRAGAESHPGARARVVRRSGLHGRSSTPSCRRMRSSSHRS